MPLGTLTLVPKDTTKLESAWKESIYATNAVPEDHPVYWSLRTLLWAEWIRIYIRENQRHKQLATIRVYVLPDDVGRRYLAREDTKARKALMNLMLFLDSSNESWEGLGSPGTPSKCYKAEATEDDSLFYIFNTLTSPSPNSLSISDRYARASVEGLLDGSPIVPGLKTQLYPYQQRSAAMMIKREEEPARSLDPRLEVLTGPIGQDFFFDREGGRLLQEKREYDEARGGILAETMGFGKTLICLAVVLSTKGHWPKIPPEYSVGLHPVRSHVGSLVDMAAAAVGRARIPWVPYFQGLSWEGEHFGQCVEALKENACPYIIPGPPPRRSRRPSVILKGETIRLCSATLIVVPANLISQWQAEIAAHLEQGSLSVLIIDSFQQAIPSATQLLQYDIILVRKDRFEREVQTDEAAMSKPKLSKVCNCPYNDGCNCSSASSYRSPFRDLHFLRLIVDEGHSFVSSGSKGNAIHVLKRLHVDRRWIVSGTPANGLLGVEVGIAADETLEGPPGIEFEKKQTALITRRKEIALAQERKDLERLGQIVVDFLALKPWANLRAGEDPASWQRYIMPSKYGERKAKSLRGTLESLVVRHRIEDIEADLRLPPLHNRVVHLEPSFHDKLSLNLFTMVLAVNAVTSEREDQDYIFHPDNRRQLDRLIMNLRQSGFYWTSFSVNLIEETLKNSRSYLEKATMGRVSDHDRALLEQSIDIGTKALESPSWKAFSELHEIGLYVTNFPNEAREAWALRPVQEACPILLGATQLRLAQQHVDTHLYSSNPAEGLPAAGTAAMEMAWTDSYTVSTTNIQYQTYLSKATKISVIENRWIPRSSPMEPTGTHVRSPVGPNPGNTTKIKHELHSSMDSVTRPDTFKPALTVPAKSIIARLPRDSPLSKTKLCGTASAKLSYLLDRVAALHHHEKILIFYEADHIAYYIAQALELIDVRYLIYAKTLTVARRSAYMTTFNTTDNFQVMLMNLRSAAHGLHVACASRVFFVNPVWQPNVEAQAIKRAHRIGQIRPVYVETLVLKDTLEDQMLQRRKAMTTQEHQHAEKSLLDDSMMGDIIKCAAFIPLSDEELKNVESQMAQLQRPLRIFGHVGNGTSNMDDSDADLILPEISSLSNTRLKKRKRKVTFPQESQLVSDGATPTKRKRTHDATFQTPEGILMKGPKSTRVKTKKFQRFAVDEHQILSNNAPHSQDATDSDAPAPSLPVSSNVETGYGTTLPRTLFGCEISQQLCPSIVS